VKRAKSNSDKAKWLNLALEEVQMARKVDDKELLGIWQEATSEDGEIGGRPLYMIPEK
jgi:hypothetical protein